MIRLIIEMIHTEEIELFHSYLKELGINFTIYRNPKILSITEEDSNLFKLICSGRFFWVFKFGEIYVSSHCDKITPGLTE